jgi:hypothetical protein
MKSFIATVALLTASTLSANAQAKSISGQWKLQIDVAGNAAELSCTITQEGTTFKGNCSDIGELSNGEIKDGVYSWGTSGGQSPCTFTGKLNSEGKLVGKVNVLAFGIDGDFSASPVK